MYTDPKILESIRKVEAARAENVKLNPARMSAEEKEVLLKTFHPDYRENQFTTLRIGPNKGGKVPLELAALLEGKPRIDLEKPHLERVDYDADVLIIGGGGAGCFGGDRSRQRGREGAVSHKAPHGRREHDDGRGRHSGGGQAERLSRAAFFGCLRRRTLRGAEGPSV